MHEVTKKVSTVALAAVLLFCTVVPVPTGAAMFDRARAEYAYANAAVGTVAQMALYALSAACIAQGIYIAGTTINEFNINSQEIYDAFTDYYTAQNDISASELEAILAGSYTNGNVDLSALTAAGITGAIPGFAQVLMSQGTAVEGVDSNAAVTDVFQFAGADFPLYSGEFKCFDYLQSNSNYQQRIGTYKTLVAYAYMLGAGGTYQVEYIYSDYDASNVPLKDASNSETVKVSPNGYARYSFYYNPTTGRTTWNTFQTGTSNPIKAGTTYDSGYQLVYGPNYTVRNSESVITSGLMAGVGAVVADGVTAGTFAGTNQGIVQAFNPTAEQLQAGYDASILQGVEQAVADLGTISTGIAALDATMNGLLGVCQGIATTLSGTLVGQYCAAVTQWLGATPFGTVMGTVIDGLDAIPDSVADGAAVVAGGVAALPGALEGVIEGVLEGVFGQPLAIPGFLQDILAGVQAIPGALEGAIEGINFPGPEWPELPRPESGGEPFQIALPPAMQADFEADLRERVPFCYVIHMKDAVDNLSGNLSYSSGAGLRAQSNYNMRSFYFDVEIPFAGSVHFDAEPFLSQPFGALDIATTIRILATALLCFGLLYRSYKVVERSF